MKKITFLSASALTLILSSCGASYTEEQGKAANEFCNCMDEAAVGDFDIDYFECDTKVKENFDGEVFTDEGYVTALKEKCPETASKIK